MASFYANESFPLPVVAELRRLGHDVLTTLDAGRAGQILPDEEVLAYAIANGRAVLTLNRRHFVRLHIENSSHAGIVVCSYDPDFLRQASRIDEAIREAASLDAALVRVHRPAV